MKIAFIVYNGMTFLDFIGAYDPITRLKSMNFRDDVEWDICSFTDTVRDDKGLQVIPTLVSQPLNNYDIIYVPGGFSTRKMTQDAKFMEWFKTCENVNLKTSVCSGSLLLGAAGFLQGKKATSHRVVQEALKPYCAQVLDERVVQDGNVITARGVSSSLDIGLFITEIIAGNEIKEKIRIQMDYQT
jgi:transcriptional regulator GlxA family with amidase domain